MTARMWRMAAVAILMATVLVLAGCSQTGSSTQGTTDTSPIKVGVIVSLTGAYAGIGAPEKQVIEMEVKKFNDAGGLNGRKIEAIYVDDGTDDAKAVAAASKLIEQDKVVVILGPSGTGASMAIRGDIDRASMPNISMAGGSAVVTTLDKLQFTTAWTNKIVVPFTLDYLKKQGITKIGLITDTGGFGKDGKAVIEAEAPNYGITIASNQTFNVGDSDMTAQLTKIKGSDAQVVVMWNAGSDSATVLKNAASLGIKLPIYGSHGNARAELIQSAGAAAEGFKFAAGKVLMPETYGTDTEQYTIAKTFIEDYVKAYTQPPSTFAGHAFDAFNVLTNALKNTNGSTDPVKLRDAIEATKDLPGVGGVFNYSPTDHGGLSTSDLQMYEVKNGTWALAQ